MRKTGNDKKPGMTPEQHLYSDAIYRINSVVESIVEAEPGFYSDNDIQLWAIQLDSVSGEFRWLLLRREDWVFNEAMLNAIAELEDNFWDSWRDEKKSQWEVLATSWPETGDEKRLKTDFGDIDGKPLPELWDEVIDRRKENAVYVHPKKKDFVEEPERSIAYHHAFMKLVEGRSFSGEESFEGTVLELVRKAKDEGMLLDRVHSTQGGLEEEDNEGTFRVYEDLVSFYRSDDKDFEEHDRLRKLSSKSRTRPWTVVLQGAIAREDDIQHVISVPIYDGGQAGPCYGRLVGIIHGIILKECEKLERNQLGEKIGKAVRRHNDKLAAAFRTADMARIVRESVTREDRDAEARGMSPALHHFLHVLPMVQDWKSVEVLRRNADETWQAVQCWERSGRVWNKTEGGCAGSRGQGVMGSDLSILDMLRGQTTWLDWAEKSALEGYRLRFEYPDYALIPTNEQTKEVLERQYWQEQIDVWAIVLPKVLLRLRREREALRRAVSGIMGRNMSHNIGSHVLARYRAKVDAMSVVEFASEKCSLSKFLNYLQQRMDFLADVATSDRAFRFQTLSLPQLIKQLEDDKSVLLRFITGKDSLTTSVHYKSRADVQFACPGGEVGVHALYVILENIIRNSARHGDPLDHEVKLEVSLCEQDQNNDLLKMKIVDPHSPVEPNREVTLTLAEPWGETAKVNVSYPKPTGSGAKPIRDREGKCAKPFSVAAGLKYSAPACRTDGPMPVAAAVTGNSLVLTFDKALDPDSTPAKDAFCVTAGDQSVNVSMVSIAKRLDDRINDILEKPVLTSDGEAKAENWGIREMQICAHYMRGFSLLDLESPPSPRDEGCAVLKAGCHNGMLKYTIYLKRAQRMAVVSKPRAFRSNKQPQLERQGVKIIEIENQDRRAIDADVGSYEYLVVEKTLSDESDVFGLSDGPRDAATASLPVRRLKLSGDDIDELIDKASKGDSQWMEDLHKRWAEEIRDRHHAWNGKHLYGLVVSGNQALKPQTAPCWPACIPPDGGLIPVCKPLPNEAEEWLKEISSEGIAAVWVDHANKCDFCHGRISIETARSGDAHAHFLSHYLKDTTPSNGWEILAAAVSRVAVLDERVQSASDLTTSRVGGLKLSEIWRFMGVWVPPKSNGENCDLDSPNFDKCQKFLNKPIEYCEQFPIDILVVHLTILERLNRERRTATGTNETLAATLDCLVNGTQAASAEIVIVTGRGVPAVARAAGGEGTDLRRVRYLPISALLESLNGRPSKLALMQTLWSAGRPSSANS